MNILYIKSSSLLAKSTNTIIINEKINNFSSNIKNKFINEI